MLKNFQKFILRGNLVDLAIGFTVGAAFTTVAKSLVTDVIMPPISLLLGQSSLSNLFVVIKQGDPSGPYQTLEEAKSAAALTINYGLFIDSIMALLLVAAAMFVLIEALKRMEDRMESAKGKGKNSKDAPANKKCKYCYSMIDFRATRCPNCTSKLPTK